MFELDSPGLTSDIEGALKMYAWPPCEVSPSDLERQRDHPTPRPLILRC